MEQTQLQQEELENLRCIYEDVWTIEEGENLVLYAPVTCTDGAATFICKLPTDYPAVPVRQEGIQIEGVSHELEATLIDMLELQGLLGCEHTTYDRSGDPILFDLISAIREALAWRVTDEMMEELVAEAELKEEVQDDDSCSDTVGDPADWQTYELEKKAAATAKRRAMQQAAEPVDTSEESRPAKPTLTGNAAWKARLQAGETVSFRGGGNSLAPLIKSGECCTYSPVFKHEDVKVRDVVFCQVKGRFWNHMVKKKTLNHKGRDGEPDVYNYTISNIHGHENGDTTLEKIYGKVISVSK